MDHAAERTVITVDGLAGSGKSSISYALAERLGYLHFSSGILYRAVGYLACREGVSPDDEGEAEALVNAHVIDVSLAEERRSVVRIDGEDVTGGLYTTENSDATSRISKYAGVRQALKEAQRNAFFPHNIVAEGRDMGTVVFPDAALKLFITVNEETRIARRAKQQHTNWEALPEEKREEVLREMQTEITERDRRDSERDLAPTKPAEDAIVVDNSSKTLTEVVDYLYHLAGERVLR